MLSGIRDAQFLIIVDSILYRQALSASVSGFLLYDRDADFPHRHDQFDRSSESALNLQELGVGTTSFLNPLRSTIIHSSIFRICCHYLKPPPKFFLFATRLLTDPARH